MNENTQNLPIVSPDPIDDRPVAIYVHGLASGAAGTTFNSLARKFKQYRWITTNFGECIESNVAMLDSIVELHPFHEHWSTFVKINQRYDDAKSRYQSYTLQQVIEILKNENKSESLVEENVE